MYPQGVVCTFGMGYYGYGNGTTGFTTMVKYPTAQNQPKRSSHVRFTSRTIEEQAKKKEILVPIRLDMEYKGYTLRDTFTWNLNEALIAPEQFAVMMCEDLKLPVSLFAHPISSSIKDQVNQYSYKDQVVRTNIKLDITVGNRQLVDQFEWDISNQGDSPEDYASCLSTELGLGGEFKTATAYSIREQSQSTTEVLPAAVRSIIRESGSRQVYSPSIIEPSLAKRSKKP